MFKVYMWQVMYYTDDCVHEIAIPKKRETKKKGKLRLKVLFSDGVMLF